MEFNMFLVILEIGGENKKKSEKNSFDIMVSNLFLKKWHKWSVKLLRKI